MDMLTRIWERLPFGEGRPPRAYLDDAPLPYSKREPHGQPAHQAAKKPTLPRTRGVKPVAPEIGESLSRLRAERDALAQRLQRLEAMLADPEKGQNAILYYRLRAIWDMCHRDLMALSRQFREKYVGQTAGKEGSAHSGSASGVVEDAQAARLRAVQARVRALEEERKKLHYELHERDKPFKVGEKRALTHTLAKAEKQLETAIQELKVLQQIMPAKPVAEPVQAAPAEEHGTQAALNVQTRRAINITLIALAQHFYLLYREEQIAEMALRASQKPVDEVNFGLASECQALGNKTRELATLSKNEKNRHEAVRRRVEYLKGKLHYASASDAIPEQNSVNSIPTRVAAKEGMFSNLGDEIPVNVLALDYWNLNQALLK